MNVDSSLPLKHLPVEMPLPAYLGNFVEIAFDAIITFDPQTCITFWNAATERMYGWTAAEALGKTSAELLWAAITPEERVAQRERIIRLARGEIVRGEFQARRKDGTLFWAEYTARAIFEPDGALSGYVTVQRDITAQKRAMEENQRLTAALQAQLDEMKTLMEILPIGIWTGNQDCSVITGNPAAYRIMGMPPGINASFSNPEHPLGIRIFVDGVEVAPEDAPMQRVARTGQPMLNFEHDFLFPDQTRRTVYASIVPVFEQPGVVRKVVAAYADFTERKRAERTLAEYARQQAALYLLADKMYHRTSLEDVFNAALDAILSALHCDRASILLFDTAGVMRFVAWRGLSEGYRQATDGHSPWQLDEKNPQPICMHDLAQGDIHEPLKSVIQGEGIGALAFIPLVANDKLIGKFMTYYNGTHVFSESEIELSLTIARQLAFGVDRKLAEQALRESEERYRAVVESQAEMLCRFQVDGTILFVNKAYARARGSTPEELLRQNFWEFISEVDQKNVRAMLNQLTPDAPEIHIENRFQTADGERWTLWTNRALKFDAYGRVLEAQSSGIDITLRKQMEEALRRERELLERLFATMPVMVSMFDPKTNSLRLNAEFERLAGWRSDEVSIATLLEAIYPDPDYRSEIIQKMGAAQRNEWVDVRLKTREGRCLDTVWSNISLLNDQQELVMGIGIGLDVTENRRAQKQLRQSAKIDAFRVMLNDTLRALDEPALILTEAMRILGEQLQVHRVIYTEITDETVTVTGSYANGLPKLTGQFLISDFGKSAAIQRSGQKLIIPDATTSPDLDERDRASFAALGILSGMSVPLIKSGRWVASLGVHHGTARTWRREEIAFLEETAERTWDAVERARIQLALYESRNELQHLNETLEQKVNEKTAEVRALASELTKAEHRERHRLAQVLHDDLQQRLYAIQMQMALLVDDTETADLAWQRDFGDIHEQLSEVVAMTRNLSIDLSPPILYDEGLSQAINWLTSQMEEQFGLHVDLRAAESFALPDRDIQVLLYTSVRELLFNIVKHAGVDQAIVELQRVRDELHILVHDDGKGFDATNLRSLVPTSGHSHEPDRPSFGLPSLRHRLSLFGGTIAVQSEPGKGTTITLTIPVYASVS